MRCKAVELLFVAAIVAGCSGGDASRRGGTTLESQQGDPDAAEGGLTFEQMEEIKRIERIGNAGIAACYTDELERRNTKKLQGKVVVQIQIGTAGTALDVKIGESTLNAPLVHQCIQEQIRTWEFPTLSQPAWYGTTFHFSPAY